MIIPSITVAEMIEVDRLMVDEYYISLLQMMEHAGENWLISQYNGLKKIPSTKKIPNIGCLRQRQ